MRNADPFPWSPGRRWGLLLLLLAIAGNAAAQVDLTPLFDPATPGEIGAVQADWASRATEGTAFSIDRTAVVDGFTLTRVSYTFDGLTQHGFLRYPLHYDPAGDFPVMIIHHGGDTGIYYTWVTEFDLDWPTGCVADSFFVLAPSYRGEACNGSDVLGIKMSEGEPSLWDYDCDDAMAMLRAFLAVTPQADSNRLYSLGRSRGSIVAYHQAVRDPLIRRSIILFAASDYRHPDIIADCQLEVDGGPVATNTLSRKVMSEMVRPWLDGIESLAEVRERLCAWSIIHHLRADVPLQLHHGELDTDIPILHSEWTEAEMTALGAGEPDFILYRYPLAGHGTNGMVELGERVEGYVCEPPDPLSPVGGAFRPTFLRAWPNPFQGRVALTLTGDLAGKAAAGPWRLDIMDLRGRRVRTLLLDGGSVRWDGRDTAGQRVPAGVYLALTKGPDQQTGAQSILTPPVKLVVLH